MTARRQSADDFFACTAYFPKRVFVFGEFHEGHVNDTWIAKGLVRDMLEYARKVCEAGGFFYLDGKRYRYLVNPNIGPQILQEGYVAPGTLPAAPNACRRTPEVAPALYVLVTRKEVLDFEQQSYRLIGRFPCAGAAFRAFSGVRKMFHEKNKLFHGGSVEKTNG